jgi:hypothetical protein
MLQRLALANGHGWHHFLNSVNQVLPKRDATLDVRDRQTPFHRSETSAAGGGVTKGGRSPTEGAQPAAFSS